MAWHYVKYACGHAEEVQIYGPVDDRPKKKAWLESRLCEDCWEQERARMPPDVYSRVADGVYEIIAINSYHQRGMLKERGWSFGIACLGLADALMPIDPKRGWRHTTESEEVHAAERAWVAEQEWEIEDITDGPTIQACRYAEKRLGRS